MISSPYSVDTAQTGGLGASFASQASGFEEQTFQHTRAKIRWKSERERDPGERTSLYFTAVCLEYILGISQLSYRCLNRRNRLLRWMATGTQSDHHRSINRAYRRRPVNRMKSRLAIDIGSLCWFIIVGFPIQAAGPRRNRPNTTSDIFFFLSLEPW